MIAIIRPLSVAALTVSSGDASKANMLTAAPREVWISTSGSTHIIDIDLGAVTAFDSVFIGGCNAAAGTTWVVSRATGMGTGLTAEVSGAFQLDAPLGPRFQGLATRPGGSPATRYLRIAFTCPAAQLLEVGVLAIGQANRHAYAYGGGRQLIDTVTRTDLRDGGFGIDEGVVKVQFKWRFIDLTAAETKALWTLISKCGNAKSVVVVENSEETPLSDASVHYGLFDRFEAYERANPVDTVWALSMTEWR